MEGDNKLKGKDIETFTGDMVKAIESDRAGLVKKIIHENEEHEEEKKNLSPESKKNKLFVVISGVLVVSAVAVLSFVLFLKLSGNTPAPIPPSYSFIFLDRTVFRPIDGLSRDKITEVIRDETENSAVKEGGIEGIYLTENKKTISLRRFLSLLREEELEPGDFPPIDDNFLAGVLNEGGKVPFFLLKVNSFVDIFPVMRGWEDDMPEDFRGIFGGEFAGGEGLVWQDGVVENKNARILKGKDESVLMMYVFVSDSYVLITDARAATAEVVRRVFGNQLTE